MDTEQEQGHSAGRGHTWTPGQELAAKLVFGGVGCMVAVVFTNPIDVLKTRLQLQGEASAPRPQLPISSLSASSAIKTVGSSPHSALSVSTASSHLVSSPTSLISGTVQHRDASLLVDKALKPVPVAVATSIRPPVATASIPPKVLGLFPLLSNMVRVEGPRVFLAGLVPAVLRESIYSTIRVGSYDLFKGVYSGLDSSSMRASGETSTLVKLLSGLTSGMIGSVIANPTDLIKVRLQARSPSGTPRYASIADAFKSVYREEGIPGLYRGVVPTAARASVLTASQLGSYDTTKHWLLKLKHHNGVPRFTEGYLTHFYASTIAGLVCAITTSPIDTVKVRYMNQQFNSNGQGTLYKSALDCTFKTVRAEGPGALYKGFLMCWLRLGPHTMLSLMIFEKLRSFAGLNPV